MSTDQNSTDTAATAVAKQKAAESNKKPQNPASPEQPGRSAPARPKKSPKQAPARSGALLGGLALLLALVALAGTGYQWYEQQQAAQRQQPVAEVSAADLDKLATQIDSRVESLAQSVDDARQQAQSSSAQLNNEIEQLSRDSLALLSQVSELGRTDRDDWQLAEVEYLLRMAHQRVVMGGELKSAASLLANADNILNDLNMAGLHQVRKQLARDLAAVRAASELDSEGIYLRLQALQEQAASLPFFGMPEINAPLQTESGADGEGWQATLDQGWQQAVAKFKTLVVVQKQETVVRPLLSEAWQALVRERLALDLSQAKNAVILQQQAVYRDALSNARQVVEKRFLADSQATRSVLAELAELEQQNIVAELPDISGSQEAIRAYIDQKYQAQEQVAPLESEEAP